MPDDEEWLGIHAGDPDGEFARPVPDASDADTMVRCAVIGSLMPLLSAGERAGMAMPTTRATIELAKAALRGGMSATGRSLETVGVFPSPIDVARRRLEAMAREGP